MALQKDYETIHGYTANYWKILNITVGNNGLKDNFILALYKDKTSRDLGKTNILQKTYVFPILDENDDIISPSPFTIEALDNNNPYEIGYNWLKENDLIGAIDV